MRAGGPCSPNLRARPDVGGLRNSVVVREGPELKTRSLVRRGAAAASIATGLVLLQAVTALACWEWCGEDPLVAIVTPSGQSVAVNVNDYARGLDHAAQLKQATFEYTTQTIAGGSQRPVTLVHLEDTIPSAGAERFPTRAVVFYNGQQLAAVDGISGRPMHLTFIIPVA